jgi:hypothetical protein
MDLVFLPGSPLSVMCFLVIVAGVIGATLLGVYIASQRLGGSAGRRTLAVAVALAVWLSMFSASVAAGLVAKQPMPRLPMLFMLANAAGLAFALAAPGSWLAHGLSLRSIAGFQAFRLPLELVLQAWVGQGTIPESMTWTGQNYDIITGVAAVAVVVANPSGRAAYWAFNLIGLGLLLNVGRVALFSSPLPFAWPVVPPLQLAFHLPYALIAPVCVAGALAGHVVLARALLRRKA